MNDTIRLYEVSTDEYGTKTGLLIGSVPGLLRTSISLNYGTARQEETSDAQLWLDSEDPTIKSRAGKVDGYIVTAKKTGYQDSQENQDWYEIKSARLAVDSLRKNSVKFVKCSLQRIGTAIEEGTGGNTIILQGFGSVHLITQGY